MRSRDLIGALTVLVVAAAPPGIVRADTPGTGPLRHATFDVRNEVKVKVPAGAQRLRMWVALPQDNDPRSRCEV